VIEAMFNANVALTDPCWDSLGREDVGVLLDYIDNLEFEVRRLKGTSQIMDLHEAFNRRAD